MFGLRLVAMVTFQFLEITSVTVLPDLLSSDLATDTGTSRVKDLLTGEPHLETLLSNVEPEEISQFQLITSMRVN